MDKDKPQLIFLCGLPGSGKSTWAELNKYKLSAVVHSSDSIREQLGDINDQSQNDLVFKILHKRVREDLLCGKNVIVDQTGLNRKERIYFLDYILRDIPCRKVCILFATPIECCKKNNANRERKEPEYVIDRMVRSFNVPCKQEGWDDIQIVWWDYKKDRMEFDIHADIEKWKSISHSNPHHSLSIGEHMVRAGEHMCKKTDNVHLLITAYMHDCGKSACRTFTNHRKETTDIAHYYNHESYGCYKSLFYLKELFEDALKFTDEEILYTSLLIELHMRPYVWDKSLKAKERDRRLYGDNVIEHLLLVNECDRFAH